LGLDAVARGKVEADDVVPPSIDVGHCHVDHEIVGPFADIVRLQDEGECAELHLDQSIAERAGQEAQLDVEPLADLEALGRHHRSHCHDRLRQT
jgi:hypothetical protein